MSPERALSKGAASLKLSGNAFRIRARFFGAVVTLPLVTVMPFATSWLNSDVNSAGATGGGVATYGFVNDGAVPVVGRESRPEATFTTRSIAVPANCGPPPSGAVGSPTGRMRMLRESVPAAPFQRWGKAMRLSSRSFSAILSSNVDRDLRRGYRLRKLPGAVPVDTHDPADAEVNSHRARCKQRDCFRAEGDAARQ